MQVRRFMLLQTALQQISENERAFFLLSGHIQNELNSLNKVFTWCLQNPGSLSQIENLANGVQAQLYARLLAGKLLEAWNALGISFFGAKISQRIEASLHPVAQEALVKLKAYFGKSNLIYRVRNSFAFHYSAEEFKQHWLEAVSNPNFEVVLGGTVGNNINIASELVANIAILRSINEPDESASLQKFMNEVQSMTDYFITFLEGVALILIGSVFPRPLRNHGSSESIAPLFRFENVAIPYFYEHGLSDD